MTPDTSETASDSVPGVSTGPAHPDRSKNNECEYINYRTLNSSQMVAAV